MTQKFQLGQGGLYWLDDDSPTQYVIVGVEPMSKHLHASYRIDRQNEPYGNELDEYGLPRQPIAREDRLTTNPLDWEQYQDELREEALAYENDLLDDGQVIDSDPYDIDRDGQGF